MPFFVLPPVTLPRFKRVGFWRYCVSRASARDVITDCFRAVGFVAHDNASAYVNRGQNILSDFTVIYVTAGKMQSDRIAERIDNCMDFCVPTPA